MIIMKEAEVGIGIDNIPIIEGMKEGTVDLGLGLRDSMNRDRIRCYKCREYDHFAKDCLTSKQKESEQI